MNGVNLTNCDQEPIHIPGAIQPHGVLLACRLPDLVIEQASENLLDFLGVSATVALGRSAETFFSSESATALRLVARSDRPRDEGPLRVVGANGHPFDAVLHRASDGILVIELEPPSGEVTFHPRLRRSVARFSRTQRIEELWADAAEEVRALTGFDRVMVYRFDAEWNGEVVAESQRGDLEFFGLHYPASDIPAQARRLYTINWLRFIGDVDYRPVALCSDRQREPLDMSFCVLRSVSPIHCEYLRNMGVTASMSISLLRDERLWGLIACHHYSGPKVVPYAVRESSEFLGRALSWHIASRLREETATRGLAVKQVESELIHAMNAAADYRDGLATPALLELTNATGAAVLVENELRTIGDTPSEPEIRKLAAWLANEQREELFVTDRLGAQYAELARLERNASGVVAVALSLELGDFVIWFRPAAEHEVSWGGEPLKQVSFDGDVLRLSPRGSFALWKETVRGRSTPWQDWELAGASDLRLALLQSVRRRAADLRELNEKLIAADRSKDMFLAAVSHELRTPLHAILGWVQRIKGGTLDVAKTHKALEIIERNAQIQTQLVDDLLDVARMVEGKLAIDARPVDLAQVVENAIDSVALSIEASGIELARGQLSPCRVIGDPARLQQVAWNLLTNAFKFTPKGGRIDIALHHKAGLVELTVTDSGQGLTADSVANLFEPFWQAEQGATRTHKGLGLGLAISRQIVELHGGTIAAESAGLGRGTTFRVALPLTRAE